ncbi:inverse autotransporter beta domain-containing protein [Xenorhabdus bovienii]|uniref:inverse autotransporter beta domain-containing protein n=1 Tax=Xenorhabdus bovienii TaxID=40576 RepID=UPI00237D1242|nr:inverse autotransporter beta domain-containing protein [Xenorhabdus bovienii]MDE1488497.1 inverse autotransporter beta domain-containing protein [Xenorhabdus bovienii]MDE9479359.1 inverse autotransporter beta domain-containing protein [Xenorhabdus bovienii]MDE9532171.1 inverse autotransporter beta domain-containing protein [Xenorhabdus bovienii]
MLSSSPSELAEQAKSYALGKLNSSVNSEAQKWLSQFGTARINFSVDKKGKLENSVFDLLFPLYDNKTDWLLFSQFGYRNKDSRNTMNLGLGGRYFQNNWMYGLNTFFDHDFTGKNRRLGLGGEIWGDYLKLSANAYYRLSDWQHSRDHKDYCERPANGYDINGEFFLPAYPNLGAKLTYEQYFGDNVTLFNRDTKQKNPSLAKLGLTYTPIPLVTMGVDYKQGGSGHTETQFLANLNYRLGVPLSVQLSPDNVASMRTLAGSRYDLVERNYNIVLDHQKKQNLQLSLPEEIVGYSHEQQTVTAKFPDSSIKKVEWISNGAFTNNKGQLSDNKDHTATITFPKYSPDGNNNYPISAVGLLENNQKLPAVQMHVIVRPFVVKKEEGTSYITPAGPLPASGKDKDAYTITPVMTFDTPERAPVKNAMIEDVKWITEPPIGDTSGLALNWTTLKTTKTDENGKLQAVTLTSTQPHQNVKVYLQIGDADKEKQLVGTVSFGQSINRFHVDSIQVEPKDKTLTADGNQAYTYTAVVLDGNNQPLKDQKIDKVQWDHDKKDKTGLDLQGGDTTDGEGKLTAKLTSSEPVDNVMVTLSIEGNTDNPAKADKAVSFDAAKVQLTLSNADSKVVHSPILVHETYTLTVTAKDASDNPETNKKVIWPQNLPSNVTLTPVSSITDGNGEATATLTSTQEQPVDVTVSVEDVGERGTSVEFKWPTIKTPLAISPTHGVVAGDKKGYKFTATVIMGVGADKNAPYTGKNIKFKWQTQPDDLDNKVTLSQPGEVTAGSGGKLEVQLTSTQTEPNPVENAKVCLAIVGGPSTSTACSEPVSFVPLPANVEIKSIEVNFDPKKPLKGNWSDSYLYKALVFDKNTNEKLSSYKFKSSEIHWSRDPDSGKVDDQALALFDPAFETDPDGYLTVKLKSHVGIKGVKVKLMISTLHGNEPVAAETAVDFQVAPQLAGLYLFNQGDPTNVNKFFSEQERPYNAIGGDMRGELRTLDNNPLDNPEYTWEPKNTDTILPGENKGTFMINNFGKVTINAQVKTSYGDNLFYQRWYIYNMNILGLFNKTDLIDTLYDISGNSIRCENIISSKSYTPNLKNVIGSGKGTALSEEFPNAYSWGLFDGLDFPNTGNKEDFARFRVDKGESPNNGYELYNVAYNKMMDSNVVSAFLICITGH